MNDIGYFANVAEIISGITVVFGIGFGFIEFRRHKEKEQREASANLARSFQTEQFASAIRVMFELPGPIDKTQYDALPKEDQNLLWVLFCSMESIGILVHQGDLPLELVDEFFSLPSVLGWQRLRPYVEELREDLQGPQAWEWYQWLSESLQKRHREVPRVPAHIAHRK